MSQVRMKPADVTDVGIESESYIDLEEQIKSAVLGERDAE